MDSDIIWLDEAGKSSLSLVGGKSVSLMKLLDKGFRIPPGFCLTADVYKKMFSDHDLLSDILNRIRNSNLNRISELEEIAQFAQRTMMNEPLPKVLEEKILAAYNRLGEGSRENIRVAVRSSAPAEGLPSASFAGQHESFLNVQGENELILHLKKCWASLWTARAISYRQDRGFDHVGVFLAVIIQKMIQFDVSGVLFTENPVDGDENRVLINATWGLGEAVVLGKVSADEYVVAKDTGTIVSKKIAEKSRIIVLGNHGSEEREVLDTTRNLQCLPDRSIQELAKIGRNIEQTLGRSQEVEWGIWGNDVYILQSRTITSLNKSILETIEKEKQMLKNSSPKTVWSDMMVSEVVSYPRPLSSELLKQFMSKDGSFGIFYEKELAFGRPFSDPILCFICGRPYFNRNEFVKPFAFMGFPLRPFDYEKARKDPSLANSLFPQVDTSFYGLKLVFYFLKILLLFPYSLYKLLNRLYRIKKIMNTSHKEFTQKILPAYLAYINDLKKTNLEDLDDTELVSRIRSLIYNITHVSTMSHLKCEFAANIGYYFLKRIVGERANNLICGIEGDKHLETNIELWKVVQEASPQVVDILLTIRLDEIQNKLSAIKSGKHFLQKLNTFLDNYGHRAYNEFELSDPRWREDPEFLFEIIRTYVKAKQINPVEHIMRLKKIREEEEKNIRDTLSAGLINKMIPIKYKVYSYALKLVHIYTPLRESTKFYYLMEMEQLRRFLLELGSRFTSNKYECLNNKYDIFFLFLDELQAVVQKKLSSEQIKRIIVDRKTNYRVKKRIPVPSVIFRDSLQFIGEEQKPETAEVLFGTGISKGRISGIARVVMNPSQINTLNHGEILVAPTTDPGWTPLFFIVSAMVMNTGNALSHGAVLAREYGLPAVVNVPKATDIIGNGRRITVDVAQGKVYLH